jgi:hypothetical protein
MSCNLESNARIVKVHIESPINDCSFRNILSKTSRINTILRKSVKNQGRTEKLQPDEPKNAIPLSPKEIAGKNISLTIH